LDAAELLGDASGPPPQAPAQTAVQRELLSALIVRRQVRILVREQREEEPLTTKLAIYRLTRIGPNWCLIGRSSWHCGVTLVYLDQIERVEPTADPYEIPPRFNVGRFLAQFRSTPKGNPSAAACEPERSGVVPNGSLPT
jgi:hypothetical protein